MAQAEVLCIWLSTCVSVRCIGGNGGCRCRPRAAAGLAEAIERVLEIGVDAGVVVQKDGTQEMACRDGARRRPRMRPCASWHPQVARMRRGLERVAFALVHGGYGLVQEMQGEC